MPLIPITPLHTPRLTVRGVTAADLSQLLPINADDRVTHHLPYASWQSMADAEAWLARIEGLQATGSTQQWVVTRRETGEVMGAAVIFKYDEVSARAELGYLMSQAHWGQGLMRETLSALLDHAFARHAAVEATYGLRRMEAEANPLNTASNALLQRLGFTREGTLRQRWTTKGKTYDTHIWGLLRDEWLGRAQTPTHAPCTMTPHPDPSAAACTARPSGAVQPTCAPTCPLCGQPNRCTPAAAGSFEVVCWCTSVKIAPEVLERVPVGSRGKACLGAACAERKQPT